MRFLPWGDPPSVTVQPLGDVLDERVTVVADALEDAFAVDVGSGPRRDLSGTVVDPTGAGRVPVRELARDEERDQYDAVTLVDHALPDATPPVVWVTDLDLFFADESYKRYVFGIALLDESAALLSTARLAGEEAVEAERTATDGSNEHWDEIADERLRKQAIKQCGRALGGEPCDDSECVLSPTAVPSELDRIEPSLCSACVERIGEDRVH